MHRLRRCGAAIGAVRFAGRSAVVAGARSAAAAPAASPERPARTAGRMLAGLLVVGGEEFRRDTLLSTDVSTGMRAPVELGGVTPKDWPDACRLLSGVRKRADDTSSTRRWATTLRIGRATVEIPVCNRYDTDLRVVWVARSDKEAATYFGDGGDSTVGADEERRTYLGDRLLRVGRVVVSLDSDTDSEYDADVVARAVVRNARAQAS